jgi:hypothetical protein
MAMELSTQRKARPIGTFWERDQCLGKGFNFGLQPRNAANAR